MSIGHQLRRIFQGIGSRLRAAFYQALGMQIIRRVWLRGIEWPARPATIVLAEGAMLDRGVTLLTTNDAARIVIGPRVYINRHTMLDASEWIEIAAETMIGPFCYITDHDHAVEQGTSPGSGALVAAPTRIGARCWLGAHVTVLKGVTIGEGTVVGAGAVVTKSLPPNVIAAGVPARVIKEVPKA